MGLDTAERHPICLILNFASTAEAEEGTLGDDKVIWKDLMCEGMIARTPGIKEKVPFKVISQGRSSSSNGNIVVSMSDLIASFEAKAFPDVTIPDGHPKPDKILPDGTVVKGDSAFNNHGYVRGLRVKKRTVKGGPQDGKEIHVLQAGLGFTEPEAAGKVRRGSVPNVSAGVYFDFVRKADERYFRAALNHVALTKSPWMQDLDPFKRVYFSDGDDEYNVQELLLDEDKQDGNDARVIWNEQVASNYIRNALSQALNPKPTLEEQAMGVPERPRAFYYVEDVTHNEPNIARVEESFRGRTTNYVVPYSVDNDGAVSVSPQSHWQEGRQAMIAASEDDSVESFEEMTVEKVRERLQVGLSETFGSDKLTVAKLAIDGRALIRNTETGAEHLARWREVNGHAYFADTADWTVVRLSASKPDVTPATPPTPHAVTFDLNTPEGRVAAARQRRAGLATNQK